MGKPKEFNELIQFASLQESELLTSLLKSGDVTFKLIQLPEPTLLSQCRSRSSVVIQVLEEDLKRAEALLAGYKKTQGVPFN